MKGLMALMNSGRPEVMKKSRQRLVAEAEGRDYPGLRERNACELIAERNAIILSAALERLTQYEVADRYGVSRSTAARSLRGER